jgi:transcriptional regulator
MAEKTTDFFYGSLGLIILKTLEALGPLHGYRLARRIEQISGDHLALNQGTLYPALLRLEQAGWISSAWDKSESGRDVKVYTLTKAGRKRLKAEEAAWAHAMGLVARFLKIQDDQP